VSYSLWMDVLAITPKLPIDQLEYDAILQAWRALANVAEIEDEWDCVIQNYIELEMEILRSAMHTMILNYESRSEMQDIRLSFARRLSNLLHSCRAYRDHTPHFLDSIPDLAFAGLFKSLTKKACDEHFSYRFMEALRNYAQHYGLPLHEATFDSSWSIELRDGRKEKGLQRHSVTATVNLDKLRADKKFKCSILTDLDPAIQQLDVATMTRKYLEVLCGVHVAMREKMAEVVNSWKITVRAAIARYADVNDGNVIALCVCDLADDDAPVSKTHIFDDMISETERKMRRNGSLINLHRRYVSNELPTTEAGH
jgi:hypothetical protein